MDQLSKARFALLEIDELVKRASPIHRLHPTCKLLLTVCYIVTVMSFPKYDLSGLVSMVLYPTLMFQIAGISMRSCFYKLRMILPLVCAVGLADLFLDQEPLILLDGFVITGGMVSMVTLLLKGLFALMASFLLMATTSIDALCAALRRLHMPGLITTLILLAYRYIGTMMEEASIMTQAYKLRAPQQKGIHFSAWGSFLGQLLLRSMDRAEELFNSMLLRGYQENFYYSDTFLCRPSHVICTVCCVGGMLCLRRFDVASTLGDFLRR